jgi:transposase
MKIYYIGMDVHKKIIAYCIKTQMGDVVDAGTVAANRPALLQWLTRLPQPWTGAMEATLCSGWIYDFLKPHAGS